MDPFSAIIASVVFTALFFKAVPKAYGKAKQAASDYNEQAKRAASARAKRAQEAGWRDPFWWPVSAGRATGAFGRGLRGFFQGVKQETEHGYKEGYGFGQFAAKTGMGLREALRAFRARDKAREARTDTDEDAVPRDEQVMDQCSVCATYWPEDRLTARERVCPTCVEEREARQDREPEPGGEPEGTPSSPATPASPAATPPSPLPGGETPRLRWDGEPERLHETRLREARESGWRGWVDELGTPRTDAECKAWEAYVAATGRTMRFADYPPPSMLPTPEQQSLAAARRVVGSYVAGKPSEPQDWKAATRADLKQAFTERGFPAPVFASERTEPPSPEEMSVVMATAVREDRPALGAGQDESTDGGAMSTSTEVTAGNGSGDNTGAAETFQDALQSMHRATSKINGQLSECVDARDAAKSASNGVNELTDHVASKGLGDQITGPANEAADQMESAAAFMQQAVAAMEGAASSAAQATNALEAHAPIAEAIAAAGGSGQVANESGWYDGA